MNRIPISLQTIIVRAKANVSAVSSVYDFRRPINKSKYFYQIHLNFHVKNIPALTVFFSKLSRKFLNTNREPFDKIDCS